MILLSEIEKTALENKRDWILYGIDCLWWTDNPDHAKICQEDTGPLGQRPVCPFCGGNLLQRKARDFFYSAKERQEAFGNHGLDTFVMAYHLNSQTCRTKWTRYEDCIIVTNPQIVSMSLPSRGEG